MSEANNAKWYILHTYSGYESLVKKSIEQMVENGNLQDVILDIKIPTETLIEDRNGKKKAYEAKVMPCYVFIKLVYSSQLWFMLTNTRGVTGFVGPESKPVPLTEAEIYAMGVEKKVVKIDYEVGDMVTIIDGAFEGIIGTVHELDVDNNVVCVVISMLGRETPVDLELDQVEKVEED